MKEYRQFVNQLESELQSFLSQPKKTWKELALKFVDGSAANELRRLIDLETRRESGAFFTNSLLIKKVLSQLKPKFDAESFVYDPACGAGNILIAVFDFMHQLNIISDVGKKISGTDIHKEFVEAAKFRLFINQLLKISESGFDKVDTLYTNNIILGDGLQKNIFYEKATHVIVNPPFNLIDSKDELNWAKGKVSAASIFMDKIIQNSKSGVSIIAILPDVLRSGSRYEKWRALVQKSCVIERIELLGQFDKHTDVDVFSLQLTKRKKNIKIYGASKQFQPNNRVNQVTIENLFDVCVGTVVDNRDPHEGTSLGYIISKGLEGWCEKKEIDLKRRHKGRFFDGPFVVIKRTSRMGDSHRAVATIINASNSVYVDNHLIILRPKSGSLSDCRRILTVLKDKMTDDWINNMIRCRHLTVKVVSKIPVWK